MQKGADGSFDCIIGDIATLAAKKAGIVFKVVMYPTFSQAWQGALKGEVDILGAVTASKKHSEAFNLTKPYLKIPIAVFTRDGYPHIYGLMDLLGKRVAVDKGHVSEQWIRRDYPGIKLVAIDGQLQGILAVAEGKAEACAGALGALIHLIRENDISGMKLAAATEYHYELGFAVRKDWPLMPGILNKAIKAISPKELAKIRSRRLDLKIEKAVDWNMVIIICLAVAGVSGLLILVAANRNRKLSREISERKRAESQRRESQKRLIQILDFLPDPTWVIDNDGRIIIWNKAMERLSKRKAADMLGKGDYEHAIPFYGQRRPCLIDLVIRQEPTWSGKYLKLEQEDDTLAFSETFHPMLGHDGKYLAGSASRLYDSEGSLVGAIETLRDVTSDKTAQKEREALILELREALGNVKTLSGLLPICANCKKIRDDKGYWKNVEEYIQQHSDAGFSHGICPDCAAELYDDVLRALKKDK